MPLIPIPTRLRRNLGDGCGGLKPRETAWPACDLRAATASDCRARQLTVECPRECPVSGSFFRKEEDFDRGESARASALEDSTVRASDYEFDPAGRGRARRWIPIFCPEIKKKSGLGESARASALRDLWAARSTAATWRALSIRRLSEVARSADPVCDSRRSEEAGCCAMSLTREVDVQCRGLPIRISEKSIA
jgi:hypothetical protein